MRKIKSEEIKKAGLASGAPREEVLKRVAETETRRLREVLEKLPVYVVLLTPDYHVPFANKFFRDRFGESKGRRCYEYLFDRTEPCEICETYKVLKTNKELHWKWTGPDGRDYDIYDMPFVEADGSRMILEMGIDVTERNRAEKALRELTANLEGRVNERTAALAASEAKYRSLFSNMSNGFAYHRVLLDRKGEPVDYVFLEINDAFESLTSLKREKIIGRKVTEVIPGIEKDPAGWIKRYGRVALTREPVSFESYAELLGRWYQVTAYSPEKEYFVMVFDDITQRKKAEQEIRRAKEEWERTFDSVPDLIAILDKNHRVVRANRAMAERLGVTPAECAGLPCYKLVHNTDEPSSSCPHAQTLADLKVHTKEIHEDRLAGDFLVTTTPIMDEDGNVFGTVHVARDITASKKAEVELRQSEERLNVAQEIAHVGSWELDLVKNELRWSDEAYRIFGLKPQQFGATYEAFLNLVHPDDRVKVDSAYTGSIREGKDTYDVEHRVVRPDGEIRVVLEKCYHIRDNSGRITMSIGMVHDITVQKELEEQRIARARVDAALDELKEFLKLLETLEIALVLIERDGTVRFANNRAGALLQIHAKDVILDHFDEDVLAPKSFANEIYMSKAVKRSFLISRQDYKDMYLLIIESMQEEIKKSKKILSSTTPYTFDDIIGLDAVKKQAEALAMQNVNVLLLGESGTGKELFASAVHNASHRAGNRFVVIHCGAIPDTLFESEIFGHEKGAFTDARAPRTGKIEYADGGTVFFDELGDLPLSVQSKLLRVIEDKHVVPVGGNEPKAIDVRFIYATNRNLAEMVRKKEFREDLYYRVNSPVIRIPPLRERRHEIPDLVKHLSSKIQAAHGYGLSEIPPEAYDRLLAYDFPGNVRELEGMIRNALLLSKGEKFAIEDERLDKLDRDMISLKGKQYRARLVYERFLANNRDPNQTGQELNISSRQVYRYVKIIEDLDKKTDG